VVAFSRGSDRSLDQWELDTGVVELTDAVTSDVIDFVHNTGSHDVNCVSWGSVTTAHIDVELGDGTVEGEISVLFVHVVDSGS